MAQQISPYALTTLDRVKTRLGIDNTNQDTFITQLINVATEYIEGECNRRFKKGSHTEIFSFREKGMDKFIVSHAPVKSIASVETRSGTFDSPNWTAKDASYYTTEDEDAGIIAVSGSLPTGVNVLRITYTAGVDFDFDNEGDPDKHELPQDITDLCERIVVRLYNRRHKEGEESSNFEGSEIRWMVNFTKEDKLTLNRYKRTKFV